MSMWIGRVFRGLSAVAKRRVAQRLESEQAGDL
jgi:hypothetical protein